MSDFKLYRLAKFLLLLMEKLSRRRIDFYIQTVLSENIIVISLDKLRKDELEFQIKRETNFGHGRLGQRGHL